MTPRKFALVQVMVIWTLALGLILVPLLALKIQICPIHIGVLEKFEPFSTMLRIGSVTPVQLCNFEALFYVYAVLAIGLKPVFSIPDPVGSLLGRFKTSTPPDPMATKRRFYLLMFCALVMVIIFALFNLFPDPNLKTLSLFSSKNSLIWIGVWFCLWPATIGNALTLGLHLQRIGTAPSRG